jgi:calmodulin
MPLTSACGADAQVAQLDINGSGAIELSEFVSMMRQRMRESDGEQEIRDAFTVFDRNGNGYISAQELRIAMSKFGACSMTNFVHAVY